MRQAGNDIAHGERDRDTARSSAVSRLSRIGRRPTASACRLAVGHREAEVSGFGPALSPDAVDYAGEYQRSHTIAGHRAPARITAWTLARAARRCRAKFVPHQTKSCPKPDAYPGERPHARVADHFDTSTWLPSVAGDVGVVHGEGRQERSRPRGQDRPGAVSGGERAEHDAVGPARYAGRRAARPKVSSKPSVAGDQVTQSPKTRARPLCEGQQQLWARNRTGARDAWPRYAHRQAKDGGRSAGK